MKRLRGFIAATFITGLVAVGMVGIGANALTNPNSVAVSNAPAQSAQVAQTASVDQAANNAATDQATAQIEQLQTLIKQYQDREQQYQTEIKSLSQQLSDANTTANQAQQVLMALQQRGIIQISQDGRIFLRGG